MLIKLFTVSKKDDYRQVLKRRQTIALAAVALGLVTMVTPPILLFLLPNLSDHAMGYYSGGGAAIISMGLFAFFSTRRTLRDEKRLRAEQIKETDERTQEVKRRAASLTILLSLLGLYLGLLVAVLMNPTVYLTLLGVFAVFLVLFLGSLAYYGKKL